MNIQEAFQKLKTQLETLYETTEAGNIADWVVEALTGYRLSERIKHGQDVLTAVQIGKLENYEAELLRHRPVQYVLGESYFYGLKLYVDEAVLIPRPETEELVDWILKTTDATAALQLIDIGTGSGCIPLALKKNRPRAGVYAVDVSEAALAVAQKNAADLKLDVRFSRMDLLDPEQGRCCRNSILSSAIHLILPWRKKVRCWPMCWITSLTWRYLSATTILYSFIKPLSALPIKS